MRNQLYRSNEDAIIGGVCGGIGEFLGINPVILRLIFVILAFGKGIGIWLYLLFWIIIPLNAEVTRKRKSAAFYNRPWNASDSTLIGERSIEFLKESRIRLFQVIGVVFILIGMLYLFPGLKSAWGEWLSFDQIWPIILIMGGLAFIFRRPRGENKNA